MDDQSIEMIINAIVAVVSFFLGKLFKKPKKEKK